MRSMLPSAVVVALALAACASPKQSSALASDGGGTAAAPRPAATGPSATLDPNSVVATINGQPIKGAELDNSIKGEIQKATSDYQEKIQKTREDGLDELIAEKLVELEAANQKVSKDDLIKKEITDKVPAPTDEQIQAFYDKVVKPQYDVPLETVKPQIEQQLKREHAGDRAKAYFDELRTKYHVKESLPVRRVDVAAVGPSRGPADAKVTIVEFSDFQCPFCGRATPTVEAIMKKYDGKVRLVFREFPLPFHEHAEKAAEAALCANDQGKFWPMYDKMFANQDKLEVSDLKATAKELGLDTAKFDKCLDSGEQEKAVKADIAAGEAAGVDGTPAFFINGRPYSGALPQDKFEEAINAELSNG